MKALVLIYFSQFIRTPTVNPLYLINNRYSRNVLSFRRNFFCNFLRHKEDMKNLIYYSVLLFAAAFYITACSDNDITKNGSGSVIDPTILITDEFGDIIGGDTTDWCYHGGSGVVFNPVYPNPTYDTMKLHFTIPQPDTLTLFFVNSPGDTLFIWNSHPLEPGFYDIAFSSEGAGYNSIIKRLYLKVKSNPNNSQYCRYYGDVQFY